VVTNAPEFQSKLVLEIISVSKEAASESRAAELAMEKAQALAHKASTKSSYAAKASAAISKDGGDEIEWVNEHDLDEAEKYEDWEEEDD